MGWPGTPGNRRRIGRECLKVWRETQNGEYVGVGRCGQKGEGGGGSGRQQECTRVQGSQRRQPAQCAAPPPTEYLGKRSSSSLLTMAEGPYINHLVHKCPRSRLALQATMPSHASHGQGESPLSPCTLPTEREEDGGGIERGTYNGRIRTRSKRHSSP